MSVPIVELIAYTVEGLDDASAARFLRTYEDHCTSMNWVGETAEAFDEVDDGLRQVGLSHAFARPGPWVAPAVEHRLFAEVQSLLAWLEEVSGDLGLVFAIRYDDRDIGSIGLGVTDQVVRDELATWARDLERLERDSPLGGGAMP